LVRQVAQRAADDGVELFGPDGLWQQLIKQVLETGLEVEMSEHLGHDKHEPAGRNGENSRNGARTKTVTLLRRGTRTPSDIWSPASSMKPA
jgi:transposase-like protein